MKNEPEPQDLFYFLDYPVKITRQPGRRSMTIKIKMDQPLQVLIHTRVPTAEVINFLDSKKNWIQKNLHRLYEYKKNNPHPEFIQGSLFPFLGERKYFQFATDTKKNTAKNTTKKIKFSIADGFLVCAASEAQQQDVFKLQTALSVFYKREAVMYLTSRVQMWSERTGLVPTKINFRAPRTRWGSCSSKQQVSLNWKLICHSPQLIDYVIVHELCHLQFLNHSAQFWSLLESIIPNHREIESVLQHHAHLGNFLA